jgi:hypothetical protein
MNHGEIRPGRDLYAEPGKQDWIFLSLVICGMHGAVWERISPGGG